MDKRERAWRLAAIVLAVLVGCALVGQAAWLLALS